MGIYLNQNNIMFQEVINSEIYIDKTMLIGELNRMICTSDKYVCISRPRRFGKSMAANMLTAYYSRGCDSREMFENLKISKADSFEKHLNKYNVISFDMQKFLVKTKASNGELFFHAPLELSVQSNAQSEVSGCCECRRLGSLSHRMFQEV